MIMTSRRPPPLKLDSISELPERFHSPGSPHLNLGVESPSSIVHPSTTPASVGSHILDDWGKCGFVVNSNIPARRRSWRSLSWSAGKRHGFGRFQKERFDSDCAICFEPAINPRKTSCCTKIFCFSHLADWLKSNKKCPSCNSKCISPLSPIPSTLHSKHPRAISPVPSTSSSSSSSEVCSDRSTSVSPAPPSQEQPSEYMQSMSSLIRLLPAISAASRVASEEIGKLLTWIAFILVLCVIASPS